MKSRSRAVLLPALTLATAAALVSGAPSTSAAGSAAREGGGRGVTIATGLDDPFGLARAREHRGLLVAENAGKVTRVFLDGRKRTILSGVPGVAGVAGGPRRVFAVTGGPNEEGSPTGGKYGPSRVIRMTYNGKGKQVIANLLRYELRNNPDGQVQFVDGEPVDAISNPFAMVWSRFGLFVADGGANDVLKVNPRTGRVSTFFVPPNVTRVPACQGDVNANPGARGCDSVPTGVDVVGNSVYISTLGAEAPRAGRVYKVHARTGKLQRVWKNLTGPTGVAARRDGTVFVSHVLHNAPQGPPGPGFDPADVGRITRIRDGVRTHADVTMPTGLELKDGKLYATSWSIASFLGIPDAGKVVRVRPQAFHR